MTWFRVGGAGIPASLKTSMNSVLNKKFGTSGQNYPPKNWPDDVNLLGPLPEKTVSGAIASFSDGADDVPLKALVFGIEPVQASGTPSPSNPLPISGHTSLTGVHCGKNLVPLTGSPVTGTLEITPQSDGTVLINGSKTTNTIYTCGSFVAPTNMNIRYYGCEGGSSSTYSINIKYGNVYGADVYNGRSSLYTIAKGTTVSYLIVVRANAVIDNVTIKPMILLTSETDETFAPYSAESKKWEFPPFGKNLTQYATDFTSTANVNVQQLIFSIDLVGGTTYTISCKQSESVSTSDINTIGIRPQGGSITWENTTSNFNPTNLRHVLTFTPSTSGTYEIIFWANKPTTTATYNEWQVEQSNSFTAYEPYQSMFSGQVNALTGETESGKKLALFTGTSSESWSFETNAQSKGRVWLTISDAKGGSIDFDSNMLVPDTAKNAYPDEYKAWVNNNSQIIIGVPSTITSASDWKTWLASNNLQLCYELADPISIDMDSVDWQSKYADNNFYSDCGDTSVTYRQDIDLALSALQGSRSLSASLMRSGSPEEISEPEENIQNTEETEGESDER